MNDDSINNSKFTNGVKLLSKISFTKTILFNFYYFNLSTAFKFPVLIARNIVIRSLKGKVEIKNGVSFSMIRIGFGDIAIFDASKHKGIWRVEGTVTFNGSALLGHGTRISIEKNGNIIFGRNNIVTAESTIVSTNSVSFGDNCLVSWKVMILDDDFHFVDEYKGDIKNELPRSKPISIGNDVWIGCNSTILKGSIIPDNSIIGAQSLINGRFQEPNCVIAGNPAKIVKQNIKWRH